MDVPTKYLQRAESKILRALVSVPRYVTNQTIHKKSLVEDEILSSDTAYHICLDGKDNNIVDKLVKYATQKRQ